MIGDAIARALVARFPARFRRAYECELLEQGLDATLAARRLNRRKLELERDPIRARARQLCAEAGRPVPPALLPRQ